MQVNELWLEPHAPGWQAIWERLQVWAGDFGDTNPENGESWQYMGTYFNPECGPSKELRQSLIPGHWIHQFRHRSRPFNRPKLRDTMDIMHSIPNDDGHGHRVYVDMLAMATELDGYTWNDAAKRWEMTAA